MPIKWKSKILLIKPEVTYGTDPTPTGAANAILAVGLSLVPMEGDDASRDLELPYLGSQPAIPVGLRSRLRGRVEMAPSGTPGVAPAWGPILRACGVAEVVTEADAEADPPVTGKVEYLPISDNHESVTVYFWIGGTRHVLKGARGTGTIRLAANGIPYFEFDLLGLFSTPSEQTRPTVDLSDFEKPLVANSTNTPVFKINSTSFVLRSFALNLGNSVEPRLLIGHESILIVDRAETAQVVIEAVPMTTYNPYAMAADQTDAELLLTHGTAAGKTWSLKVPTAQQRRPQSLDQNQNIVEWPLDFAPLPSSTGNDQWELTLT